jgi:hypothetical protein
MTRTVRSADQLTMFDAPADQHELFGTRAADDAPPEPIHKGPPTTREEILEAAQRTIEMLRGCDTNPWSAPEVHFETGLFRMRVERFSPEVRDALLAAFDAQASRLDMGNAPPPASDSFWAACD